MQSAQEEDTISSDGLPSIILFADRASSSQEYGEPKSLVHCPSKKSVV